MLYDYGDKLKQGFERDYGKGASKDLVFQTKPPSNFSEEYTPPEIVMPDNTFTNNSGASTGFAGGLTPNMQIKPEVQDRLKKYGF
jgi:hypothetical protein